MVKLTSVFDKDFEFISFSLNKTSGGWTFEEGASFAAQSVFGRRACRYIDDCTDKTCFSSSDECECYPASRCEEGCSCQSGDPSAFNPQTRFGFNSLWDQLGLYNFVPNANCSAPFRSLDGAPEGGPAGEPCCEKPDPHGRCPCGQITACPTPENPEGVCRDICVEDNKGYGLVCEETVGECRCREGSAEFPIDSNEENCSGNSGDGDPEKGIPPKECSWVSNTSFYPQGSEKCQGREIVCRCTNPGNMGGNEGEVDVNLCANGVLTTNLPPCDPATAGRNKRCECCPEGESLHEPSGECRPNCPPADKPTHIKKNEDGECVPCQADKPVICDGECYAACTAPDQELRSQNDANKPCICQCRDECKTIKNGICVDKCSGAGQVCDEGLCKCIHPCDSLINEKCVVVNSCEPFFQFQGVVGGECKCLCFSTGEPPDALGVCPQAGKQGPIGGGGSPPPPPPGGGPDDPDGGCPKNSSRAGDGECYCKSPQSYYLESQSRCACSPGYVFGSDGVTCINPNDPGGGDGTGSSFMSSVDYMPSMCDGVTCPDGQECAETVFGAVCR